MGVTGESAMGWGDTAGEKDSVPTREPPASRKRGRMLKCLGTLESLGPDSSLSSAGIPAVSEVVNVPAMVVNRPS